MDLWYTYVLTWRNGVVFYVGKGSGERIEDHEREARSGCGCDKCRTIRLIWDCGEVVVKYRVAVFPREIDALQYEWFLIHLYGPEHLTNVKTHDHFGFFEPRGESRKQSGGAGRQRGTAHVRDMFELWWLIGDGLPFKSFYREILSQDMLEYYEKNYLRGTGAQHYRYLTWLQEFEHAA